MPTAWPGKWTLLNTSAKAPSYGGKKKCINNMYYNQLSNDKCLKYTGFSTKIFSSHTALLHYFINQPKFQADTYSSFDVSNIHFLNKPTLKIGSTNNSSKTEHYKSHLCTCYQHFSCVPYYALVKEGQNQKRY